MKTYLLDTSVIIDYLRGKPEAVVLINRLEGKITSSYFCLAELMEGVARSADQKKTAKIIKGFFFGLSQVYGLDESVATQFGQLRKDLKTRGRMIADIDIFLAATCLVDGLTLVTLNKKHFQGIANLLTLI